MPTFARAGRERQRGHQEVRSKNRKDKRSTFPPFTADCCAALHSALYCAQCCLWHCDEQYAACLHWLDLDGEDGEMLY